MEAALQRPMQQKIRDIESEMRQLPQLDIPVEHTFGPGFYARTIRVPAGATITGKVHATEHIFFLSKGEMMLATEGDPFHVTAGFQAICKPGLKRIGHALTDAVVTNVHITTETDLVKLEAMLITPEALSFEPKEALQ